MIVGTAGHVDHGKSTLVHALTGTDPDRLVEEKRRGMTIDLGFAHLDLGGGLGVGIVDVPGHARFVHNMLAGVHGMDAVLLVVAADEGIMAQTREHLDILQLLEVERMVVALTKVDLVDNEWRDAVAGEVRAELESRGISATIVPVAAPGGTGLEQLRGALRDALDGGPSPGAGLARMPVDRAFTMAGFGLVVTGSLVDGGLTLGDELELVPGRTAAGDRPLRARVRGLQQHGQPVQAAISGSRVAVNLQGLRAADAARGQVLAPPGSLPATRCIDVKLRVLQGSEPLKHNAAVVFYAGTAEVQAHVRLLEGDAVEPGGTAYVQVRLDAAVAVRDGDRFVVRRPSPPATIGGGTVVDAAARPHRRRQAGVVAGLQARAADGGRLLEELRRAHLGTTAADLARALARPGAEVEAGLEQLAASNGAISAGDTWFAAGSWARLAAAAAAAAEAHQATFPLRAGMPRERLRSVLGLSRRVLADVAAELVRRGTLLAPRPDLLATPGFAPRLGPGQRAATEAVLAALAAEPLSPPALAQLRSLGLDDELLAYLVEQGLATRVRPEMLILAGALQDAEARVRGHLALSGTITVAEARDLLGSSRRTVVPLLEYLDSTHVTRRDGDVRRLRTVT